MIASLFQHLKSWLGRRAEPRVIPFPIERRMATLGLMSRSGGRGSDLAAAELRGMQTVILSLRRSA